MSKPFTFDWQNYINSREAHQIVYEATKYGELTRPDTCELCGNIPKPIKYKSSKGKEVVRPLIFAHHWMGHSNPLDVWWICNICNSKLQGQRYHNGSVDKEKARAIVMGLKRHVGNYKKPAITNITRRCKGKLVRDPNKQCRRLVRDGLHYCHLHKGQE